jgi:hypothetical protein
MIIFMIATPSPLRISHDRGEVDECMIVMGHDKLTEYAGFIGR